MCTDLNNGHLVTIFLGPSPALTEPIYQEEGTGPHDDEIDDHRDEHPKHVADIVENPSRLFRKDQDDPKDKSARYEPETRLHSRVKEANKSPWTEIRNEGPVETVPPDKGNNSESSDYTCDQGNTKVDQHCYCRVSVFQSKGVFTRDDIDEE